MSENKMSLFYQHTYGRRFPVPLLALEVYAQNISAAKTDNDIYDVLVQLLSSVCKVKSPCKEDIEYFVKRLQEVDRSLKKDEPKAAPGTPRKSFGTSFSDYLQNLSLDSAVLRMTGYDMQAASRLYCEVDRDDVMVLVADYYSGKAEENLVAMEAAMYGSGNSYKEDKKPRASKANTHDLATPEGIGALRSMGF